MRLNALTKHKLFRPVFGAVLAALSGLGLWQMPLGEPFANASYDCSTLFAARRLKDKVVLVLMDDAAHHEMQQEYGKPWDRALHAQLLHKLKADGCPLVVFDVFFEEPGVRATDDLLAQAMREHGRVVLGTEETDPQYPGSEMAKVVPLQDLFQNAAAATGVARTDATDYRDTARRHWPFPASADAKILSLPWAAAKLAGAQLSTREERQWLRYYGEKGAWDSVSYHLALSNAPGFFRDKIVFIGREPKEKKHPDQQEIDKFRSPYTRWNSVAVSGVEVLATTFLNLINGDWLQRPIWVVEGSVIILAGILLGGALPLFGRVKAFAIAGGAACVIVIVGVGLVHFTNYWFPWLIVVGGQLPCALACALVPPRVLIKTQPVAQKPGAKETIVLRFPEDPLPDAPEYELITPPIGQGGFGKVWLARSALGQWQALKAVYQSNFGLNRKSYETEFKGLQRYKPVSEKHSGLLRIELVSRMKSEGYFYYVMELGDPQVSGWEKQPNLYKPKDLDYVRKQAQARRLSVFECLRIVNGLAEALDFLHSQGLTHRDIKPSNVIFVNDRPKLADVGLVADIRPPDESRTRVGTPGYMPPPPELPGTPQADIYALGMVLYVISTGSDPEFFPKLSSTLIERSGHREFLRLNAIILKACQPDLEQRYKSVGEMLLDLRKG